MARYRPNTALLIGGIIIILAAFLPITGAGSFGTPKDRITCDVTIKNPFGSDPLITNANCQKILAENCFLPFSLFSAIGIEDKGTIQLDVDGIREDKQKYSIVETESRSFTLKSGCLKQGTHQAKLTLFDENGQKIGTPINKAV